MNNGFYVNYLCGLDMWIIHNCFLDNSLFNTIYTLLSDISIIYVNYPHSISINDGDDVDNDH